MRPVYATRFKLQNRSDHSIPDMDEVRTQAAAWVEKKYATSFGKGFTLTYNGELRTTENGFQVTASDQEIGGGRLVQIYMTEPDDQGRLWHTSVMIAGDGTQVEFSIVLRVEMAEYSLQPLPTITTGPPRVVRDLVRKYICWDSGVEIASRLTVVKKEDVGDLITFILHPNRTLPIILVSQGNDGRTVRSTETIQRKLFGLAHVYEIDYDASYGLTDSRLGREGSCFEGAVRVYWPGFIPEAFLRHPLYFPRRIWEMTEAGDPIEEVLFRKLSDIAASRYGDSPILRKLRSAADAARVEEVQKLRDAIREARDNPQQSDDSGWLAYAETVSKQNDELASRVKDLENQVESLGRELRTTKQNMLAVQQHQEDIQETAGEAAPAPTSVSDALTRAQKIRADNLVVWDSAFESAASSASARSEEVLSALEAIADLAVRYFETPDHAVGPWQAHFEERGFSYAVGDSETTMNMYGDQRQFRHQGVSREMQRHITIAKNHPANCVQIYFDADEETGRFAVGYCGAHLQTSRSTF